MDTMNATIESRGSAAVRSKLGSINNPDTTPGRLYAFLYERSGEWFTSRDLARRLGGCHYLSTLLSAVRQQLPSGESLERRRHKRPGAKGRSIVYAYRLVGPNTPAFLQTD